jgi:asparaginyl-tRNA synthetase
LYETIGNWKRTHAISELPERSKLGEELCLMGWVSHKTVINNIVRLELRGSTGSIVLVLDRNLTTREIFEKIKSVTIESVVGITGKITEISKNEIKIKNFFFKIFNLAHEPYPINSDNLDLALTNLLPKRHLVIRLSNKIRDILKVRAEVLRLIRYFLDENGFMEFPSPTIQWATDPGVRTAHLLTMPDFRKTPYVLASSAQLYKQAALTVMDKGFTIAPGLRSERTIAKLTGRHLSDFYELDVEVAFATYEDIMKIAELMIQSVILGVKDNCEKEFQNLNREISAPKIPFKKITHEEAIKKAFDLGVETGKNQEISWEAEAHVSRLYEDPFWVIDYPTPSRAWYYRQDLDNPKITKSMDLLYPEGYGEGITGGEREYDYGTLVRRIKETGEDPTTYEWYVEMFKFGMPPSAGFGLGIERLVRFICGLKYIWEATMFPRVPGITSP